MKTNNRWLRINPFFFAIATIEVAIEKERQRKRARQRERGEVLACLELIDQSHVIESAAAAAAATVEAVAVASCNY